MATAKANGIDVAYRLDGPADAAVVLLCNGLAMDMSMWEPQIEALTRRFRVLRYDYRGHGGTQSVPGDYSLDLLAADAHALMRALGVDRAHLIGTSLGAMIAQQFALRQPDAVLSIVLCATTSNAPRARWTATVETVRRQGLQPAQIEPMIANWFTPAFHAAHPSETQRMRDMVLGTTADGFAGGGAAIRDMNLATTIQAIRAPTLVIAGEDDLGTPVSDQIFIAERIPGAQLVRVAGAAHMPTIEQTSVCNAAIMAFLDRVSREA